MKFLRNQRFARLGTIKALKLKARNQRRAAAAKSAEPTPEAEK